MCHVIRDLNFFLQIIQTVSEDHPASYSMGTGGQSRRGVKVGHSLPSCAEFKNEWSCTSVLLLCVHAGRREKIKFQELYSSSYSFLHRRIL